MSLGTFQPPRQTIALPGGDTFGVRGLSLADVTALVASYGRDLNALFSELKSTSTLTELGIVDPGSAAFRAMTTAPAVVAAIIALAADEPDAKAQVAMLPGPTQIEALEAIGRLTFEASGGPKKVWEMVIRMLQGTNRSIAALKA